MTIWNRIAKVFRGSTLGQPDRWLVEALRSTPSKSGQIITPDTALQCAAVYACVRVLAESVAQLPLVLYRRTKDGGKERATDHPLYSVLHSTPNSWQTSFEYREGQMASLGLRGNAYAYIVRAGNIVRELIPIHPERVQIKQNSDFSITYSVRPGTGGDYKEIPTNEIHHLRGLSTNGLYGLAPISQAREAIGLSLATEEHGARLFQNGARPGGIVHRPKESGTWSEEAAKRFLQTFREAYSGEGIHKTALLEDGMTFEVVSMTSEDAQFLQTRKYQRSEIAAVYRVPPHLIGDLEHATFSNIEQQSLEFVQYTLMPWLKRWEQAISRDLLSPSERETYFAEFLVDGLLRGDVQSRFNAYGVAITNGWMNRNEVRVLENMNPEPGLDEFLKPLNMTPGPGPDPKPQNPPTKKAA